VALLFDFDFDSASNGFAPSMSRWEKRKSKYPGWKIYSTSHPHILIILLLHWHIWLMLSGPIVRSQWMNSITTLSFGFGLSLRNWPPPGALIPVGLSVWTYSGSKQTAD